MKNWMSSLASHYDMFRNKYRGQKLMIVFDIDGTILDMRHIIMHSLNVIDTKRGTEHFKRMEIKDIDFHETNLTHLLDRLQIPDVERNAIIGEYEDLFWSSMSILEAHRPFRGVLEVIRWFQLQPNTFVGLNTGRPESLRFNTLQSINRLGSEYRVTLSDDLLFMGPPDVKDIAESKVRGMEYFRSLGFKVFAVVDNEPENLEAISKADRDGEILLLHADTIFKSKIERVPRHAVKGKDYDLTRLMSQEDIPKHTQFVWCCDNTTANLDAFLRSNINWIEIDLRGFSLYMQPIKSDVDCFSLDECLSLVKQRKKGVKLNLYGGGLLLGRIMEMIHDYEIDDSRLWLQGSCLVLGESGFRSLRRLYPSATLQCPVDIFAPAVDKTPDLVKDTLLMFREWGINRFAINWSTPQKRKLFNHMRQWGFEVDIYNVSAFGSFLRAALLLPDSITSHFNFSAWGHREDKDGITISDADDAMFRLIA